MAANLSHSSSPTAKFIEMNCQAVSGTGIGRRTANCAWGVLQEIWQQWAFRTHWLTCFRMTLKWYCWSKWSNVYTPTGGPYQHFIMMLLNWSQQLLITFQYIPLPMVPYMLIKLHAFCYCNLSWFCLFALLQRSALALDQFHNSLMIKEERNGGAAWVNHPRTNANVLVSFVALEPHVPYLWICIPPFKKVSRPSCGGICFSIRFLWSLYYLMI